ncbi:MAG TPA: protein kinase [Kofleriaceae bacterium]|nr:protein kinase [Kofleriaceae bacterium]
MRVCTACRRLLGADAAQCPDDGAAPEVVETLPPGARLGEYRIDRVLGDGGMGFVYAATREGLKRRVAIKMLRPELAKLEQIVTRFLNEAKAVNLIEHQHIVNIYDYSEGQGGAVYFVMEYLEGETLDDLMYKRRPMPVPLLLHLFGQIGKALAAAHAKRIVHRDLKPANVFVVAREGNPYFIKLLDFGIAQLRGEGAVQGLTMAGMVMGTPQYMSPEQISGGEVDARTDVWAFGVMMYLAATGQAPFTGEEFAELANKILHHPPPPAGALVPLPASLSALIASCLERDPAARCPSMLALIAGLGRVKQELGLDDDAILAAAKADAGAAVVGLAPRRPQGPRLEESLQEFQGVPAAYAGRAPGSRAGAPPRRSRLGAYLTAGAVAGGLASAGLVLLGRGDAATHATAPSDRGSGSAEDAMNTEDAPSPGPHRIAPSHPALDDLAGWRALAERRLRGAIASGTLQQKGFAVDALAATRVRAGQPLLHLALKEPPAVRIKAARALGELALPDSAPKVEEALLASGDRLKIELAAVLYRLGGTKAHAILMRGLADPGLRLTSARALAHAGNDAGRGVLAGIVKIGPAGHEPWRLAAGGLLALGDAGARELLEAELAQSDAARAIGAAELLARAGDAGAREPLARSADEPDFPRRGDAAVALARLGDRRALGWVPEGLASLDTDERKHALAICGLLGPAAAAHAGAIVQRAASDPDPGVRMTAEAALLGL